MQFIKSRQSNMSEKTIHISVNNINKDNMEPTIKSPNHHSDQSENESASGDSGRYSLSPNHLSADTTVTPNFDECEEIPILKVETPTPATARKRLDFSIDSLLAYGSSDSGNENSDKEADSVDNNTDNNSTDENNSLDVVRSYIVNGMRDKGRGLEDDATRADKSTGPCKEVKRDEVIDEDREVIEDVGDDRVIKKFEVNESSGVSEGGEMDFKEDACASSDLDNDASSVHCSSTDSDAPNIEQLPESTADIETSENCIESANEERALSSDSDENVNNISSVTKETCDKSEDSQSPGDIQTKEHNGLCFGVPAPTDQHEVSPASSTDAPVCRSPIPTSQSTPRKKLKRTQYSKEDLQQLNQHFQQNPWLSPEKQERLAAGMGYTETQIKTWFQNKRASIFGSRRPKKRPLQELFFNQPPTSKNLFHPQNQQQQKGYLPLIHTPSPQTMQHDGQSVVKYLRKEDTDDEHSLHFPAKNRIPVSAMSNTFPVACAPLPQPINSQTTNVCERNYQQPELPNEADEQLYNRGVQFEWNTPKPLHNTPLHHDPPLYPPPVTHYFPLQYAQPSENTLAAHHQIMPPNMYRQGYPPYPVPMPYQYPGLVHPSLWTPPFYSPFHMGATGAFPAISEHQADLLRNGENAVHHSKSSQSAFVSSSQCNSTKQTTPGADNDPPTRREDTIPLNQDLLQNCPNQRSLYYQRQESAASTINVESQSKSTLPPQNNNQHQQSQEQRATDFSTFMEGFTDRLHQTANGRPSGHIPEHPAEEIVNVTPPQDRVSSSTCSPPIEEEINVEK